MPKAKGTASAPPAGKTDPTIDQTTQIEMPETMSAPQNRRATDLKCTFLVQNALTDEFIQIDIPPEYFDRLLNYTQGGQVSRVPRWRVIACGTLRFSIGQPISLVDWLEQDIERLQRLVQIDAAPNLRWTLDYAYKLMLELRRQERA